MEQPYQSVDCLGQTHKWTDTGVISYYKENMRKPCSDVCIKKRTNLWPNGIVPYEFDNNVSLELELIEPQERCIQAKPGTKGTFVTGQRVKLSAYDIKALNALYPRSPTSRTSLKGKGSNRFRRLTC
ncbi:hypothetical protein RhiirA4_483469 [Rhizophagus irregularis]|uniref:Uncharacterized protein n=1 Tax=Rhizophagus irregularis TaxID=588596 RepID=A0A2I1HMN4_9GLOM|nr:hypothetical protein RhiirA4_483469 [Rhizophagus irregularis]